MTYKRKTTRVIKGTQIKKEVKEKLHLLHLSGEQLELFSYVSWSPGSIFSTFSSTLGQLEAAKMLLRTTLLHNTI